MTVEIDGRKLSYILDHRDVRGRHGPPAAVLEQPDVTAGDLVTGGLEKIDQVSTDIALMASHENIHWGGIRSVMVRRQ